VDSDQASGLVRSTLGVLTGALAKNSSEEEGARALDQALEKDHDGSVFDRVGDLISDAAQGPGAGILGHVLGSQRPAVETEIGRQAGVDSSKVGGLMETLAPLLMGALGREKREQGLDAGGIASILAGESRQAEERDDGGLLGTVMGMLGGGSSSGGGGGGLLSKILGLLGGLFKRRS